MRIHHDRTVLLSKGDRDCPRWKDSAIHSPKATSQLMLDKAPVSVWDDPRKEGEKHRAICMNRAGKVAEHAIVDLGHPTHQASKGLGALQIGGQCGNHHLQEVERLSFVLREFEQIQLRLAQNLQVYGLRTWFVCNRLSGSIVSYTKLYGAPVSFASSVSERLVWFCCVTCL
jgi:hypothetical protein